MACSSCRQVRIQGILCHEKGCPEAWRDVAIDCFQCGMSFLRTDRYERICEDCRDDNEREYCDLCGDPISGDALKSDDAKGVFCSDDCMEEAVEETRAGQREALREWEIWGDDLASWFR